MADVETYKLVARAEKLSRKGLKGKAIGQKLGMTTAEANRLLTFARCDARLKSIDKIRLTDSECVLLLALAGLEKENLVYGHMRSVESKSVALTVGRSSGWTTATINRRIGGRRGNPRMGLVVIAGNGYLSLTDLGWLVVHAIEARANIDIERYSRGGKA